MSIFTSNNSQPFGQQQSNASQSAFGGSSQQPQQQDGQGRPHFGSPMTLQELGSSTNRPAFSFGVQQQQPPQQQQGGFGNYQQTPQTNTFAQPPQQQQQQPGQFSQFGNQTAQPGFGQQSSQQQQQQYPLQQQQQPWTAQSGQLFGQQQQGYPGMQQSQQHQQGFGLPGQSSGYDQTQQQQPQMQQVYLPGYLSRIKGQRGYSPAASRNAAEQTTSTQQDNEQRSPGGSTDPNAQGSRTRDTLGRRSMDGQPSSPVQGFSSSFFSSSTQDAPPARFSGSESIFGAGGLRGTAGSRKGAGREGSASLFGTPARDSRSASRHMRSSSVGMASPPGNASLGFVTNEDDDAPPFEALADGDSSRMDFGSFGGAGTEMSLGTSPGTPGPTSAQGLNRPASSASANQRASTAMPAADSALCTLLLYGFPSTLTQSVLAHFSAIGEITSHASLVPSADEANGNAATTASECLRIVYAAPHLSLRALRRSGELVAGAAYVGVRFADEGLHREMLLNGINSHALLSAAGQSAPASTLAAPATPNSGLQTTGSSGSTANGQGTNAVANRNVGREVTPSFGRPISMVDSPAAALRARTAAAAAGSSSPFGKVAGLFGGAAPSNPGTPNRSSTVGGVSTPVGATQQQKGQVGTPNGGVMGRIGDAIFGW